MVVSICLSSGDIVSAGMASQGTSYEVRPYTKLNRVKTALLSILYLSAAMGLFVYVITTNMASAAIGLADP